MTYINQISSHIGHQPDYSEESLCSEIATERIYPSNLSSSKKNILQNSKRSLTNSKLSKFITKNNSLVTSKNSSLKNSFNKILSLQQTPIHLEELSQQHRNQNIVTIPESEEHCVTKSNEKD